MQADAQMLLDSPEPQAMHVDWDVAEMMLLYLPVSKSAQDDAQLLLDLPGRQLTQGDQLM